VVLVVDQFGGKGNVLNFNVGDGVKFALPNVFWTRLQAKYGTVSPSRVALVDQLASVAKYSYFFGILSLRRFTFGTTGSISPLSMRLKPSSTVSDPRMDSAQLPPMRESV
jgi:hypothetical protein